MSQVPTFIPPAMEGDIFKFDSGGCNCTTAEREGSTQGLQLSQLAQTAKDNSWLIIGAVVLVAMIFGSQKK